MSADRYELQPTGLGKISIERRSDDSPESLNRAGMLITSILRDSPEKLRKSEVRVNFVDKGLPWGKSQDPWDASPAWGIFKEDGLEVNIVKDHPNAEKALVHEVEEARLVTERSLKTGTTRRTVREYLEDEYVVEERTDKRLEMFRY